MMEVGRNTNNKLMKDVRNQLAHCSISYSPFGTVSMEEKSVMRQLPHDWHPLYDRKTYEDENGHEKVYVDVKGKRKVYTMFTPWNNGSNYITSFEQSYPKRVNWYLYQHWSQAALNVVIFLERVVLQSSGQLVCPHVRDGIEKAYIRDEFGDITGYLAFNSSPNNAE